MSYKTLMVGLEKIFKIDHYLLFELSIDSKLLCDEYKTNSIVSFCVTGKFLDQL